MERGWTLNRRCAKSNKLESVLCSAVIMNGTYLQARAEIPKGQVSYIHRTKIRDLGGLWSLISPFCRDIHSATRRMPWILQILDLKLEICCWILWKWILGHEQTNWPRNQGPENLRSVVVMQSLYLWDSELLSVCDSCKQIIFLELKMRHFGSLLTASPVMDTAGFDLHIT